MNTKSIRFPALDETEALLKQAFDELGPDYNFDNLKCIQGTAEEKAREIKRLGDELENLGSVKAAAMRQAGHESGVPYGGGSAAGTGPELPSLMPDSKGMGELHAAITGRQAVRVETKATVTTTDTGRPASPLGMTGRGGPIRIAELGMIDAESVEWGGSSQFPILAAGTPPSATAEGVAKPEYDGVSPGTATPQTLAVWTDLSGQALSIPNLRQKLENKLARLVAQAENELLRAKVAGTAGVATQAFTAGDQSVQILRSAAIIEADLNQRPNLMLYNPADTAAIFGTAVSNAAPQEVSELSVRLFGMASLPLNTQPAGFVLMGAWDAGSRMVIGLRPTFATDPYSQMKSNVTTVLLEEAVDLAVEEPTAFRTVDIVTA